MWSFTLLALAMICRVGKDKPCIKNVRATAIFVVISVFKGPPFTPKSGTRIAATTAPIKASVKPCAFMKLESFVFAGMSRVYLLSKLEVLNGIESVIEKNVGFLKIMSENAFELNLVTAYEALVSASEKYESALINNDVETLVDLFWESPHTVRYGPMEHLYGSDEIAQFRASRPSKDLQRTVTRKEVFTVGEHSGVVNLQFERRIGEELKLGRQSQFWMKLPEQGWKIMSAHVSFCQP